MAKWLDKYEQGGLVLKKKTKDNYGKKPNVNDVKVSAGPGFEGDGYTAQNWKSPAWGGQFAMGGALPGAVGFTYARTQDPAPSNGKYTKKTKASAQLGIGLMPDLISSAASIAASIPTMDEVKKKAINVIKDSPKLRSALNSGLSYIANTDWGKEKLKNLANNIDPHGYGLGYERAAGKSPVERIYSAAILNKKEDSRKEMDSLLAAGQAYPDDSLRVDLMNQYAGLPQKYNTLKASAYKPTMGDKNQKYFNSPILDKNVLNDIDVVSRGNKVKPEFKTKKDLENFVANYLGGKKQDPKYPDDPTKSIPNKGKGNNYLSILSGLGEMTYGIGEDEKGHYLSYYDNWDLNPYSGMYSLPEDYYYKGINTTNDNLARSIIGNNKENNATKRIGTPTNIYNRIYFDKKTGKPKMQNGGEMSFYQNGLDFKPKSISQDGKTIPNEKDEIKPITTSQRNIGQAAAWKIMEAIKTNTPYQLSESAVKSGIDQSLTCIGGVCNVYKDLGVDFSGVGNEKQGVRESRTKGKVVEYNPTFDKNYKAAGFEKVKGRPIEFNELTDIIQKGNLNPGDFIQYYNEKGIPDHTNIVLGSNPDGSVEVYNSYKHGQATRGESKEPYVYTLNPGAQGFKDKKINVFRVGDQKATEIRDASANDPSGITNTWFNYTMDKQIQRRMKILEKDYQELAKQSGEPAKKLTPSQLRKAAIEEERRIYESDPMFKRNLERINTVDFSESPKEAMYRTLNKQKNGGWLDNYSEPIRDDRGQWAHPGEVTEIDSNDITMQGVDYPVLGISDTGDTQMMYPDQDYKFDGEKVTEYPMAQNGKLLNKYTEPKMLSDATRDIRFEQSNRAKLDQYYKSIDPANQPSISQWNPKPGEVEAQNAREAERVKEYNNWVSKFSRNPHVIKGTKNLGDAGIFALDVMTLGEGALALNTIAKPIIKAATKKAATIASKAATKSATKASSSNYIDDFISSNRSYFEEKAGEKLAGAKNRKAIAEGNKWFEDWANHPETAKKIRQQIIDQKTFGKNNPEIFDRINTPETMGHYEYLTTYKPGAAEYPLADQKKDLIKTILGKNEYRTPMIHADNSGVSYRHGLSPWTSNVTSMDYYTPGNRLSGPGTWISRTPAMNQAGRKSVTIHENTHDWLRDDALTRLGYKDEIQSHLSQEAMDASTKWVESGYDTKKNYLGYLADPTEVHARIMQARQHFGLTPTDKVTSEMAESMLQVIREGKTSINKQFADIFSSPKGAAQLFNKLPVVAPVAVGVGAAATTLPKEQKNGGWLNKYK
jgi:hypothetical protein